MRNRDKLAEVLNNYEYSSQEIATLIRFIYRDYAKMFTDTFVAVEVWLDNEYTSDDTVWVWFDKFLKNNI
jgi:hypothetical protein